MLVQLYKCNQMKIPYSFLTIFLKTGHSAHIQQALGNDFVYDIAQWLSWEILFLFLSIQFKTFLILFGSIVPSFITFMLKFEKKNEGIVCTFLTLDKVFVKKLVHTELLGSFCCFEIYFLICKVTEVIKDLLVVTSVQKEEIEQN